MNALQSIKKQLNVAHTENGDLAYKSTGSACLDFFSLCGGMRKNLDNLDKLFAKAFAENPILAIKILFYIKNTLVINTEEVPITSLFQSFTSRIYTTNYKRNGGSYYLSWW